MRPSPMAALTEAQLILDCVEAQGGDESARGLYARVYSVAVKIIEAELAKGRRVSVPQLGIFGVAPTELGDARMVCPVFEASSGLLSQFRMRADRAKTAAAGPLSEVKPISIARSTGVDPDTCRVAFDDILGQIRSSLGKGNKVGLDVRVGRLLLEPGGTASLERPRPLQLHAPLADTLPPPSAAVRGGAAPLSAREPLQRSGATAGGALTPSVVSMPVSARGVPMVDGAMITVPPSDHVRQVLEAKLARGEKLENIEIEALLSKRDKREAELVRNDPMSARAVLQENKLLSQKRKADKGRERKDSLALVDRLLEKERQALDNERQKQLDRREQQAVLSKQYKERIIEKESVRENAYATKVAEQRSEAYFPFNEGEVVETYRAHANARLRAEMQEFTEAQRNALPPRSDKLLDSVRVDHNVLYPLAPNARNVKAGEYLKETVAKPPAEGPAVVPYVCQDYPKFLTRARQYLSRRTETEHVKLAMAKEVDRTRENLERMAAERREDAREHEEGKAINESLRYDDDRAQQIARKQNAEYVHAQMTERETREASHARSLKEAPHGYWGPEEKIAVDKRTFQEQMCKDLVAQMAVNQNRKLDSRDRNLRQERCLVENAVADMLRERDRQVARAAKQKDALKRAWKNQVQMRTVRNNVELIGK